MKFTKLAKSFPAEVGVALDQEGPWFDAKSIVKVMAAKAPKGTRFTSGRSGDGAAEAIGALVGLMERNFDEEQASHARSA